MIIECPSCRTKFSVDQTQLEGIATPRFHCSRCDHFFEHSRTSAVKPPAANSSAQSKTPSVQADSPSARQLDLLGGVEAHQEQDRKQEESSAEAKDRYDGQIPLQNSSTHSPTTLDEILSAEDFPPVKASWPDETQSSKDPLEVDLSSLREGGPVLRTSVGASAAFEQSLDQSDFKPRWAGSETQPNDNPPLGDLLIGEMRAEESRAAVVAFPAINAAASGLGEVRMKSRNPGHEKPRRAAAIIDSDVEREEFLTAPLPNNSIIQRLGFWSLAVVPFAMMLGFLVWSQHLEQTPTALESIFGIRPKGLPQLAPPGLEVTDLSSSLLTLDDGKRALQITGNLLNATPKTFVRVKLDARIFAADNREVRRLVVSSQNELLQAKVESLSESNILSLQAKDESSRHAVSPSSRLPFRIIFPGVQEEDVRWYSAGIYSCETLSS